MNKKALTEADIRTKFGRFTRVKVTGHAAFGMRAVDRKERDIDGKLAKRFGHAATREMWKSLARATRRQS